MKKSLKKILATALISATMVSSMGTIPVFAASSTTGTVGGISCSGSVSYSVSNKSATATTSFGAGGTITVTAKVCYIFNGQTGAKTSSNNSSGGGTSATAKMTVNGTVCGGRGTHGVVFNGDDWHATTSSGLVW